MQPIMNTYGRLPVTFTKGEGVYVTDENGKSYLDALSGIAVCGLGHGHPAVTRAIRQQADNLVHTSNLYGIGQQQSLAEKLTAISGMDNVFFGNSGAEANEAAIKIARKYGNDKGHYPTHHIGNGRRISWPNSGYANRHGKSSCPCWLYPFSEWF